MGFLFPSPWDNAQWDTKKSTFCITATAGVNLCRINWVFRGLATRIRQERVRFLFKKRNLECFYSAVSFQAVQPPSVSILHTTEVNQTKFIQDIESPNSWTQRWRRSFPPARYPQHQSRHFKNSYGDIKTRRLPQRINRIEFKPTTEQTSEEEEDFTLN